MVEICASTLVTVAGLSGELVFDEVLGILYGLDFSCLLADRSNGALAKSREVPAPASAPEGPRED